MAPLTPFPLPPATHPVKSAIFHSSISNSHDSPVPPTDQLETLLEELKRLKTYPEKLKNQIRETKSSVERSLHRLAEQEHSGVKEESQMALSPDSPDEIALSQIHGLSKDKTRHGTPSSIGDTSTKKKVKDYKHKKRKRDEDDTESRATPLPSTASSLKVKSSTTPKVVSSTIQDFNVPPPEKLRPTSLLPDKPTPNPPHSPLPLRPEDVKEDFSKLKPPGNQIPITTFYSSIDPYLRPIREEDIGWLEYSADEAEPFFIPRLGKHYLEIWAETDAGVFHGPGHQEWAPSPAAPNPSFDPSQISNDDLCSEDVGHGPLTERVVSALLPVTEGEMWTSVKAAEDAMVGRPGGSGAAASRKEKSLVGGKNGLEERLGGTLRYHEILDPNSPSVPDYSDAASDPISTALRMAQEELRQVIADNKARKKILAERAKNVLAKQEYIEMREQLDRSILGFYSRLQKAQRKDTKESSTQSREREREREKKRKKRPDEDEEGEGQGKGKIPPCALGLGPDEDNYLVVPGQLMELVRLRREWIDSVGGILARKEAEENTEDGDGEMDVEGFAGTGLSTQNNTTAAPTPMDVS